LKNLHVCVINEHLLESSLYWNITEFLVLNVEVYIKRALVLLHNLFKIFLLH